MDAPIVNDYKKSFIIRRLLETLFGGLKIYFQFSVPIYVFLIQILLFGIIPCSTGVFLHLLNKGSIQMLYGALANGCILLMHALFVQIFGLCLQRQKSNKIEIEEVNTFGDEEVIQFDSVLGPKTWLFLVPPKRVLCNIFFHSILVGIIGGLSLYYLYLEPKDFLWNQSLRWAFTVLGLIAVSVGSWPLIVGSPPEPAVFNQLPYDLQDLSRPSHLLTFFLIDGIASNHPHSEWLFYVNCFGHILFSLSPLLWVIGALPPVDAYLLWALERWLVYFLGGSPTASNTKLMFHFVIGTLNLAVLCTISSLSVLAIISSITGFLFSLDWAHLIWYVRRHRMSETGTASAASPPKRPPPKHLPSPLGKREFIFYSLFLAGIVALSLAIYLPHLGWFSSSALGGTLATSANNDTNGTSAAVLNPPALFKPSVVDSVWGCSLALCLGMGALHHIQKPFVAVWFRNPFSQKLKKPYLKSFLMVSYIIRCGGPFVSFVMVHLLVGANVPSIPFGRTFKTSSIGVAVSCGFIFRQIWQFPDQSLVAVCLFYAVEKIGGLPLLSSSWGGFSIPTRIHFFCLIFRWVRDTWKKLKTILSISWTAVSESKQRKLVNFLLLGINLSILPVLAAMSAACSVLCLPLFPLFTLPFFLVGFPRPLRFWSYPVGYSANQCPDTVYYEQLTPYLTKALHLRALCGGLGLTSPGEMFLLRWEDRLLWVQVLETGFIHFTYSFKGLELQETSCHTTEASRVDSIFSRAFDSAFSASSCNSFPLHTLEPLCTVSAIGYSDTRNVLTGVIDSPETLDVVKDYFLKSLIYFLLYFAYTNNGNSSHVASRPASAVSRLASADITTRKAFANLPKAERVEGSRVTIYSTAGEDTSSLRSQSGRGSRLAWVSGNRVAGATSNRDAKVAAAVQTESILEEREAVLRSASWASNDGPLAYQELSKNIDFTTHFGPRERSGDDSKYKIHPSKARTYVKPLESSADRRRRIKSNNSDAKGSLTDSDSETESTRQLFLKSLPRKQLVIKVKESLSTSPKVQGFDPLKEDSDPLNLKSQGTFPFTERSSSTYSFEGKDSCSFPVQERDSNPVLFKQQSSRSLLFKEQDSSSSLNLKDDESDSLSLTEDVVKKPNCRRVGVGGTVPAYKTSLSVSLSPPMSWIGNLPFNEETLEDLQDFFPLSWFKFLLKHFGRLEMEEVKAMDKVTLRDERLIEQLLADEFLEESYRTLMALCHIMILGSESSSPTANRVFRIFSGDLPKFKGSEWLKAKENLVDIALKAYRLNICRIIEGTYNLTWDSNLHTLVTLGVQRIGALTHSFTAIGMIRVAVKLSLDHVLVGPVNNCWADLEAALEEYSTEWYVGPDTEDVPGSKQRRRHEEDSDDDSWIRSVKRETPSLFSLGYIDSKGIYTSHLLTLGEAEVHVGRLEDETVRAFWASLSGELLYLTNDDDERYSIQAHPNLLRNLTIQAADPPLGYPIYSSPPITLSFT